MKLSSLVVLLILPQEGQEVYNWMYQFDGELLVPGGATNAIAAGLLMRASAPRTSSAKRDSNSKNFRRLLNALKKIASSRSDYFKSAIEDPSTPADEISEYMADTWRARCLTLVILSNLETGYLNATWSWTVLQV
jgi:hypothetical protein